MQYKKQKLGGHNFLIFLSQYMEGLNSFAIVEMEIVPTHTNGKLNALAMDFQ
jgi:hypothetical protein